MEKGHIKSKWLDIRDFNISVKQINTNREQLNVPLCLTIWIDELLRVEGLQNGAFTISAIILSFIFKSSWYM